MMQSQKQMTRKALALKYILQGHRKGRTKTPGLLRNLKMLFKCCIWAHIDHKLGTFYYLHQHSQKLHSKIHLDTLLFL